MTATTRTAADWPLARAYAAVVGVVLVAGALLGFIPNPLFGNPPAIFATDELHNVVHLVTGAIALYIAFGLRGEDRANGVIGFGVLYLVLGIVLLLWPTLFGLLRVPVNTMDHVLHFGLGIVSLAVGYMARNQRETAAAR